MALIKNPESFAGQVHILPIRIYYEDTDLSGVVYHANYLRFMERGRSELLHAIGSSTRAHLDEKAPLFWTIRKIEIEYIRPARIDDLIEVHTIVTSLTGARISFQQTIFAHQTKLTSAYVEACFITSDGKPRRIPQDIRDKLHNTMCQK